MKVALVHDSFTQIGGAERVVDVLHKIFPEAPVFTLVFDQKFSGRYKDWGIRASGLQPLYSAAGKLQYLLPLIPWAVDTLDFSGFDLVISSSSGFVKNIRVPKNTLHLCYCHTPPRFLWTDRLYVKQEVPLVLRPLARMILNKMKAWDLAGSKRITEFLANSKEVKNRIKTIYGRDSRVIYPGVDTSFWRPTSPKKDYFLLVGRLQAHKNGEAVVKAFNNLGLPLRVAGTGRQENYLKSIAKQNISFLGFVTDEQLRDEYSGALALVFPQTEDFGLIPLEAAACGTPAIALGRGGALETVVLGVTGELMKTGSDEEIIDAVLSFNPKKYSPGALRAQAEKFSQEAFKNQISGLVKELVGHI